MPAAAHTRQGRRRALAWSARLAADLGSPVTPMLPHILAWRRRDRLLSMQKRCGGCMPVAAHTRQRRRIAMAWSDRLAADLRSPVTPMLPHISAWRRRDRLLSIQKRCGGCMPVAAHTRPGRRIAMAWPDRLAADLGSPVRPMLAHILAWASTRPILTIEILDWVDPLSVSPRSATHRHCRRWLSAVLPKRIGSQSLRLSEFLGSGNQEADWRMAIAIT